MEAFVHIMLIKGPGSRVGEDCVFLYGQMVTEGPASLILVPAAFPRCQPEAIPSHMFSNFFYLDCGTSMPYGGVAMYNTLMLGIVL